MNDIQKLWRALKPDAQAFDEVRIGTVPRFKESELSGDEWRISASVEFWRKGRLIFETSWGRNVEAALMAVGYLYLSAIDNGHAMFAGENGLCDQEGCANPATVTVRLKKGFNNDGSERHMHSTGEYRCFCDRHKHRGDSSLEDSDDNYEAVP